LELCLANDGLSISNQLFEISDREAMKAFFKANRVCPPWTAAEDEQLLHGYLTRGPKWSRFAQEWGTRTAVQLKNLW
jgi:hypothetical protein